MTSRPRLFLACAALGAVLWAASALVYPVEVRPLPAGKDGAIVLLAPDGDARWLRVDAPLALGSRQDGTKAFFRKRFDGPAPEAVLRVRALGAGRVILDGRALGDAGSRVSPSTVTLPALGAGPHELTVAVADDFGPSLALVAGPGELASGPGWEASRDGKAWTPAADAAAPPDVPLAREFPSPASALARVAPVLLLAAGAAFMGVRRRWPAAETARAALLAAWAVLALDSIRRAPVWMGFDAIAHLRYVQFLALNGRLPAPDSDWQAFQAPLYYLLSAPLWSALSAGAGFRLARFLIRVLPLACGAAQVELSWRAARRVFPGRADLPAVAAVVGGLLPAVLYMSQATGNEPLAGALAAAALVAALGVEPDQPPAARDRRLLAVGALLGFAALAKVTGGLIAPALALVLWPRVPRRGRAGSAALVAASAAAVAGWYFLRDHQHYGRWFFLPSINPTWWQEPGYRTPGQLWTFGRALAAPVYAGAAGFWDSLYSTLWLDGFLSGAAAFQSRPPWNISFMIAGAWLGLIPTALIGAGAVAVLRDARRSFKSGLLGLLAAPAVLIAAIFWGWLSLPVLGSAKASYMLGAAPALAVLAARGFDAFARTPRAKAVAAALLAAWAVAAYAAYFPTGPFPPL